MSSSKLVSILVTLATHLLHRCQWCHQKLTEKPDISVSKSLVRITEVEKCWEMADRRRKSNVDHMDRFRTRKSSLGGLAWQAFKSKTEHRCTVQEEIIKNRILPRGKDVVWHTRWWNSFRNCLTISEHNPRSSLYYRSQVDFMKMKIEHLEKHPFIIHPFSVFRIFYEMYLCVLFLMALIVFPVGAAFNTFYFTDSHSYLCLNLILSVLCMIDVAMNFITGYAMEKEKVVILDPQRIAKQYVLSIDFYCDVMSSIPPDLSLTTSSYQMKRIIDFLGLLRISRLPSFMEYINRLSDLFKTLHMAFRIVKYLLVTYLTVHWFSCLIFLVPQIRHLHDENPRVLGPDSWIRQHRVKNSSFLDLHISSMYVASSYLLCKAFCSFYIKSIL